MLFTYIVHIMPDRVYVCTHVDWLLCVLVYTVQTEAYQLDGIHKEKEGKSILIPNNSTGNLPQLNKHADLLSAELVFLLTVWNLC